MTQKSLLIAAVLALGTTAAQAQVQIQWWHAMGGELGARLEALAAEFNASQSDYQVVPTFRGTYAETLMAAIAAFRAGEQPHILQVFEVGTGTMMAARGAVYPVYQLMADHSQTFDPSAYLPAVVGYYADPEGNMLSFPFNSSTPIVYFNRDILRSAGVDPDQTLATWADIERVSRQVVASGAAPCGFTTAWPSWVQLENFSAMHNIPLGTLANGFGGLEAEFVFNNDLVARHWDNLRSWSQEGVFRWGGPGSGADAAPLFYSGECAIYMNSSAARAGVLANAQFDVGYGMLPYYDDVAGAPQNSIIGGATLWVMTGHEDAEYTGVAAFFDFLSRPEVQASWHQDTGYLPITRAAYDLGIAQGYYSANPGADVSIDQMTLNPPTENSRGLRFGSFVQIRDIISEEMEAVMAGTKTGMQAATDAVIRSNALLREFEAANR